MTRTPANAETKTALHTGMRVVISGDGDGAAGAVGVVGKVFSSGRCTVHLPDGGFRNLPPSSLKVVEE